MAGALGAEELHEARLDLFVALLELLRSSCRSLRSPSFGRSAGYFTSGWPV